MYKKRISLFILLATIFAGSLSAQTKENSKHPIAIKAYPFRGMYLDKNTHYLPGAA